MPRKSYRIDKNGKIIKINENKEEIVRFYPTVDEINQIIQRKAEEKQRIRKITLKDMVNAIIPIIEAKKDGEKIDKDRQIKRLQICNECEMLSLINGKAGCGICGCQLHIDDKSITNLVSLEETDKYGCKYPGGSKWIKSGL